MDQQFYVGGNFSNSNERGLRGLFSRKALLVLIMAATALFIASLILGRSNDSPLITRAKTFYSLVQDGNSIKSYSMLSEEAKKYSPLIVWESQTKASKGSYKKTPLKLKESKEVKSDAGTFQMLIFDIKDKYNNPALFTAYMYKPSEKSEWQVHSYTVKVSK